MHTTYHSIAIYNTIAIFLVNFYHKVNENVQAQSLSRRLLLPKHAGVLQRSEIVMFTVVGELPPHNSKPN